MAGQYQNSARHDVTNFTIREMSECGKSLRAIGMGATSMEETAGRIVRYFHDTLVDGEGRWAASLVRFFKTCPYGGLDAELQEFARGVLGSDSPPLDMKCLVLMGTAGEEPDWNSLRKSRGHRAIPLPSEEAVNQTPMVSNFITQLGLTVGMVIKPAPELLLDMIQRTYNVFHVPEALGSPFIPAQHDFVVPYGIRSALGFGGILPSGELFEVIMFFKVPVTADTANLFKTLSLNVKIAVLPFDHPVLPRIGEEKNAIPAHETSVKPDFQRLNSKVAAFEQLIEVYENTVAEQSVKMYGEIAERKRAEHSLIESEARLRTLIQTIPDPVWLKDENGVYLACNPMIERLLGARETDIVGKTDYDFFESKLAESFREHDRKAIAAGKPRINEEWVAFAGDGQPALLETIKTPVFDTEGKLTGVLGISRDITGHKRAEEEIRRLNTELEQKVEERSRLLLDAQEELLRKEKLSFLGQLSGSVGHELRSPLGVMSNAVYFLKAILGDAGETVKEYLDIIKQEIDNSQRIIADLLDFARTKPPQTTSVTANELVAQSIVRCTIPGGVTLLEEIPENLPPLEVDPQQMGQVLQNLITNAIQAMPDGGSVRIAARPSPLTPYPSRDFVEISISDTGKGISEENKKKLFQPLFTTKARGIGLGLVVCRNLVEANCGRIEVESRPGEGTTFAVILPVERGDT